MTLFDRIVELIQENPDANRRQIIKMAVDEGFAKSTAMAYYAKAKKEAIEDQLPDDVEVRKINKNLCYITVEVNGEHIWTSCEEKNIPEVVTKIRRQLISGSITKKPKEEATQ